MKTILILISKGRNLAKILLYLKFYNIFIIDNLISTRKLIYTTNYKFINIIIIKNLDIIYYINNNLVDFIFFGKDLLLEENINIFYKFYNLYFMSFFLSLISKSSFNDSSNFRKEILLVSKYLNLSKKYFKYLGIENIKFIKINSSSELLLKSKFCSLVIDIVSSGKTIISNKLYNVFNLLKLNNVLLLNLNLIYKKYFKFFIENLKFLIFNVIF